MRQAMPCAVCSEPKYKAAELICDAMQSFQKAASEAQAGTAAGSCCQDPGRSTWPGRQTQVGTMMGCRAPLLLLLLLLLLLAVCVLD